MSKALSKYLNNLKGNNLKIIEKPIVVTIDNEPKTLNMVNIIKKPNNLRDCNDFDTNKKYKVTVKIYMTKHDSVNFAFHTTWNHSNPMPLRVMYGTIVDETKNMYKMKLSGKVTQTDYCLRCGKLLTNEVSKLYGLGPECGNHYYINPMGKEEFERYKNSINGTLEQVTWEGWIPKVSIISMEEFNG